MIPISDSVKPRSFPFVNVTIILLNIIVFMYEVYLSGQIVRGNVTELDRFIVEWGTIPACTFDAVGFSPNIDAVGQARCDLQENSLLTVYTAMFIHGGWLHLAGNMLFLWIFGDNVEDAMGHLRYLAFYLIGGTIATFSHGFVAFDSIQPAVGASGAIAAVMGAYLVLFPRATVAAIVGFIPLPIPAFLLIGFWLFIQVFYGYASLGVDPVGAGGGVAYFAHIGGFVGGLVLVNLFVFGRNERIRKMRGRKGF